MYKLLSNSCLFLACLVLASCGGGGGSGSSASDLPATSPGAERPNILLIVLDDFGYNDLGANGNPNTPTPSLDDFASQGIRYTRHYTDSTCTASRVALLTGSSPAEYGFRPSHLRLSDETVTIASTLRDAGYHTEHIGKWHVGNSDEKDAPNRAGFDRWFGFLTQFNLQGFSKDGIYFPFPDYIDPWLEGNDEPAMQYTGHLTDLLTDRAIGFIQDHSVDDQPWFLNLWYFAPHAPIQPSAFYASQYPDTDEGHYHALIKQLDTNVGKVLLSLDENDLSENTLVIIVSDNGGTNLETNNNDPFFGVKTEFLEGGVRTPLLIRWPGKVMANTETNELVNIYDLFPTMASAGKANIPAKLNGRNLLENNLKPAQNFFWEYGEADIHQYGVLSGDGRWRLVNDYYDTLTLNDLQADMTGATDVSDQYPDIVAMLQEKYIEWRMKTRIVNTTYSQDTLMGGALLTGNNLQRSPGYGGFTFAIAVTPDPQLDNLDQVIAEQEGRWSLYYTQHNGLQIDVLGERLSGPVLEESRCSDIVVSTQHHFSMLFPNSNNMVINLYVNSELVSSFRLEDPTPNNQGYENPTFLGRDAQGDQQFNGTLGQPVIINEFILPDGEGGKVANDISHISSLCNQ